MKDKKKSKGFSHFILTRFNNGIYDNDNAEKWMRERVKLFKTTKDSVLSQKGDFKWVLSFDERTPQKTIDSICTDKRMISTHRDIRDYFEGVEIDTEFVITTRMDNDDFYYEGAILAIQSAFQPQVYVIDIGYQQYDVKNAEFYTSGNKSKGERFRMGPNSPFLSLVEYSDWIKTCYCRPHSVLLDGYPHESGENKPIAAKKLTDLYALMIIHSENMMNKVTGYKI